MVSSASEGGRCRRSEFSCRMDGRVLLLPWRCKILES